MVVEKRTLLAIITTIKTGKRERERESVCVCARMHVALLGVVNFLSTASCYIFIENSFVTRENSVKREGSRALLEAAFRKDFRREKGRRWIREMRRFSFVYEGK